jgi:hypothetical protein
MPKQLSKLTLLPKYESRFENDLSIEQSDAQTAFERDIYIEESLQSGLAFLDRVKKYGHTEKGIKLNFDPWFEELLELIGNLRIGTTITQGCSQIGKTLSHTLLITDLVVHGHLNTAWFYNSRENRDSNVPEQFIPVVEKWISILEREELRKLNTKKDKQNSSRYQVEGTTAIFSYASTSKSVQSREGLAKAGGAAVSFTANVLFLEERSQYPIGSADSLPRRLDASLIPTKPIRELGTPGSGQGIEKSMRECNYRFYPHIKCDCCGSVIPLDPKGCLLQTIDTKDSLGNIKESYFSASNRPVKWFHKDPLNAVETAYIACSNCEAEIPDKTRYTAFYKCLDTGVILKDFLYSNSDAIPNMRLKVGIYLSPLVRRSKTNLAQEIIYDGLEATDPTDWVQQRLGWESENTVTGLTIEMIERAIKSPYLTIDEKYAPTKFVIAGVDMGRGEDWITITEYVLPQDRKNLNMNQIFEKTARNVLFAGDILRNDIPDVLKKYNVTYGLIDNEPSREQAFDISEMTCLEVADQKSGQKDVCKKSVVEDGGREFPCWFIRSEKFLSAVMHGYLLKAEDGHPLYRLPTHWEKWLNNPSERSPIRHLTAPYLDDHGKWQRAKDGIDDMYFAFMFSEAAFYLQLQENTGGEWLGMV